MSVAPAFAQGAYGSIRGVCKDADGKPIVGAIVSMVSNDSGRKYEIKTNGKGEYFSLGIAPAETYTVKLMKDGQVLDQALNFKIEYRRKPARLRHQDPADSRPPSRKA